MRLSNLILKKFLFKNRTIKSFCSFNKIQEIEFPNRSIDYLINPNKFTYIDKTKFFEEILSNTNTEIFYQPDSFGKTFNLEIFRFFVNNLNKIENGIDKIKRKEFFEKTEVFKNKELIEKHFQKHPVIYLNFKELDEKNFLDNIEKFKQMLNTQIEQIFQYESSKDLKSFELKIFEEFNTNFQNINLHFLTIIPKELSKILSRLGENNTFILMNGIDYPLIHSGDQRNESELIQFMESLIKNTFKNNNFIYKGILTGVNELEHTKIFSSLNNIKVHSFKDPNDSESNKSFGINPLEDKTTSNNFTNKIINLCGENKNFYIYSRHNINKTKNLSFIDYINLYKKENLQSLDESSLMGYFNTNTIAKYLNLNSLFEKLVNEASKDYLSGYKLLNILNKKAENFINMISKESGTEKSILLTDSDCLLNFNLNDNKYFSFSEPLNFSDFLSFLLSNNIISLAEDRKSIQIPSIQSSLLIKHAFSNQNSHKKDYDRRLAYIFYRYLYFNKVQEYFEEIKSIFDALREGHKTSEGKFQKSKLGPFTKEVNLVFKTEKDLEKYFVHIMTLELNLEDSKEKVNIFQVDDYGDTQVSDLLKEFTLITFEDKKFAIFICFNKHKLMTSSPAAEELKEIEEVQNNEIIKKRKKKIPKVNFDELKETLQSINEEKISNIQRDEALKFLSNISDKFESVSFVSVSNYKNYLEFSIKNHIIN